MVSKQDRLGSERQSGNFKVNSRRIVVEGKDVYVKEFILKPGEDVPWHRHSEVFDVFYGLEGQLTVELYDLQARRRLADISLSPGDSARVESGTPHRPVNYSSSDCRFLLIQGVGRYDFHPFNTETEL